MFSLSHIINGHVNFHNPRITEYSLNLPEENIDKLSEGAEKLLV